MLELTQLVGFGAGDGTSSTGLTLIGTATLANPSANNPSGFYSLQVPTGTLSGDLVLGFIGTNLTQTYGASGWSVAGASTPKPIFYRIASSSSNTLQPTYVTDCDMGIFLVTLRPTSGIDVVSSSTTGTNPVPASITTTVPNGNLVFAVNNVAMPSLAGFDQQLATYNGSSQKSAVWSKTLGSAGATGTYTTTGGSGSSNVALMIALKP